MGPKELHMKAKFYTTCKAGNLDRPYAHKQLSKEASVVIQLEFASMDSLIVQLMQVLEISKTSNFMEKDQMLQVCFSTFSLSFRIRHSPLNTHEALPLPPSALCAPQREDKLSMGSSLPQQQL